MQYALRHFSNFLTRQKKMNSSLNLSRCLSLRVSQLPRYLFAKIALV